MPRKQFSITFFWHHCDHKILSRLLKLEWECNTQWRYYQTPKRENKGKVEVAVEQTRKQKQTDQWPSFKYTQKLWKQNIHDQAHVSDNSTRFDPHQIIYTEITTHSFALPKSLLPWTLVKVLRTGTEVQNLTKGIIMRSLKDLATEASKKKVLFATASQMNANHDTDSWEFSLRSRQSKASRSWLFSWNFPQQQSLHDQSDKAPAGQCIHRGPVLMTLPVHISVSFKVPHFLCLLLSQAVWTPHNFVDWSIPPQMTVSESQQIRSMTANQIFDSQSDLWLPIRTMTANQNYDSQPDLWQPIRSLTANQNYVPENSIKWQSTAAGHLWRHHLSRANGCQALLWDAAKLIFPQGAGN